MEQTDRYRTLTPVWESVWIISFCLLDCVGWRSLIGGGGVMSNCGVQFYDSVGARSPEVTLHLMQNQMFISQVCCPYDSCILIISEWFMTIYLLDSSAHLKAFGPTPVRCCLRSVAHVCVSHRYLIKQEAIALLSATLCAGVFVNGRIVEEGDTWFKHD